MSKKAVLNLNKTKCLVSLFFCLLAINMDQALNRKTDVCTPQCTVCQEFKIGFCVIAAIKMHDRVRSWQRDTCADANIVLHSTLLSSEQILVVVNVRLSLSGRTNSNPKHFHFIYKWTASAMQLQIKHLWSLYLEKINSCSRAGFSRLHQHSSIWRTLLLFTSCLFAGSGFRPSSPAPYCSASHTPTKKLLKLRFFLICKFMILFVDTNQ